MRAVLTAAFLLPGLALAQETLNYSVNWPSGLSLGEGMMTAVRNGPYWSLQLKLDATVPAFPIRDEYRSKTSENYCSVTFEKESTHGGRKSSEKSTFDAARNIVTRETNRGGKSEMQTGACARDALAFLFFLREELIKGRIPPAQTIYFGAAYQLRLQFGGMENVTVGDRRMETDKLQATLKGPASETVFEIFFARDKTRTPVIIRSPFAMGTFSMELIP